MAKKTYLKKGFKTSSAKTINKIAEGPKTEMQIMAKEIKKLKTKNKAEHQYQNYLQNESRATVTNPFFALNLCDFSSMAPIFGADGDDDNNYKMVHSSFGLDGHLSLENSYNNEESTIGFTMFLVSLTDDIGDAFNPSTGALSLSSGQHYFQQNGICMLNKKCFKIHKVMRKILTNYNTALGTAAAQTQSGTDYRFYIKHSPRSTITNVKGDWKALRSSQDPSKQRYLLIFNDDSTLDGESPAFTYNVVHTVKTIV